MRKTLAFALALFGLFVSLYLWWVYASPSHPLVCVGGGCDEVRASDFAHFFGIPTPLFGVLMYLALAALLYGETLVVHGTFARLAVLAISAAGVAVSAALTYAEAAIIHAWCVWCVAQAIAVLGIFVLAIAGQGSSYAGPVARGEARHRFSSVFLVSLIAGSAAFYLLMRAERSQPLPPPAIETIAARLVRPDSHITGNAESPVVFVEFGDLQCPACAASFPIVRNLRNQYADRVKFVFRHYPLPTIHQYAMKSAQAAECAAQQGKFWEFVDRAFDAKGDLKDQSLENYAVEVGADKARFHDCLASGATLPLIQRDMEDGKALGVRVTPTFFVGQRRIEGALTEYQFATMLLDDLQAAGMLRKSSIPTPPPDVAPPAARNANKKSKAPGMPLSMGGGASGGGFFTVKGASTDCSEDAPKGPEAPLIRTADARKRLQEGAVFVDVRSSGDFAQGHIKGARSIPLLEVERRADELAKGKPIVVYEAGTAAGDVCAAAKSAARVLLSRGYKAVVYQDGLKDWEKAGGTIEK